MNWGPRIIGKKLKGSHAIWLGGTRNLKRYQR